MTPEQASSKLEALAKMRPKIAVSAFRASIYEARKEGVSVFQRKGVGRTIWGSNDPKKLRKLAKDVRKYIQRRRTKMIGERIEGGLSTVGIPALVLKGGRSKPYTVKGRPFLTFKNKAGKRVFVRSVTLPRGTRFNQDNFLDDATRVVQRAFPTKFESAQQKALKKLGLT
jgi:hypothetical protein